MKMMSTTTLILITIEQTSSLHTPPPLPPSFFISYFIRDHERKHEKWMSKTENLKETGLGYIVKSIHVDYLT